MKILITLDIDDIYKDEILNDIIGLELICSDKTAFEYEEFTLKPMPQKKNPLDDCGMFMGKGIEGYNACIDEILGEEE